jgi:hypothetical protein
MSEEENFSSRFLSKNLKIKIHKIIILLASAWMWNFVFRPKKTQIKGVRKLTRI